jgi:hypothetical protein
MMEAAKTSEKSANFYQTTRRNNPEDSRLYTRRRENLKSHFVIKKVPAESKFRVGQVSPNKKTWCPPPPVDGGS